MRSRSVIASLIIVFALILTNGYSQYEEQVAHLDEYIEKARIQWKTPGLAVAIIKDGKTILSKGFGVRALQSSERVDEQTIFAICSTTKAMTAAAMAMLIDEGKVDWDDRVIDHMPEFILNDPYVTRELRVRDLFTHNTGVGNADLLWAAWDYPTAEILERMRHLEQSYGFRAGYTYQNIMYAAAGELIAKLSNMPWGEFIQTRIFDKLEMKNSFPSLAESGIYKNRSVPHHFVQNKITQITNRSADSIGPAGSIWSSIEDMQKWMHFMLDSAKVNGERIISEENYLELLKPQVLVTENGFYPTQEITKPHWRTYSLGWFQHDYDGRAVSFHTGSLMGTIAIIGLIPDEKLGVYVFGNLDHAEVRHAIMYKAFDVFGEKDKNFDWSTELLHLYDTRKNIANKQYEERMAKRIMNTKPSFKDEVYQGKYINQFLGEITISIAAGNLLATVGEDNYLLTHHQFDIYRAKNQNFPWQNDFLISFEKDMNINLSIKLFGYTFKKNE